MPPRPELIGVRDAVIRHFHHRATIEDVQTAVAEAARSMRDDGLTLEEILVVLKGAVTLGAEHVNHPSIPERAVRLRAQIVPWLVQLHMSGLETKRDSEFT